MRFSTIAAVSTPPGKGGVAILRVSGPDSFDLAERLFRPADGKTVLSHPARQQIYGNILSADGGTVLDDGLLTYFNGPKSFTGEDVVEFACHGGEVVTSLILGALLHGGAVMAEPGEFSRRAFLNGKLSLTAAEGIADLLDAKTEEAALLSSKAARGRLSQAVESLSQEILDVSASLWAYLDYPEEDLQTMDDDVMLEKLAKIISTCDRLIASFRIGRAIQSGVTTVIVGKPNAGKSSFFNAFLGEDRAIVTSIPGTTRDILEYPVKAGRVLLNLSDTAGIRKETQDSIEKIGIEKALDAIDDAEMIFALFDGSRPWEAPDDILLEKLKENGNCAVVIPIITKSDLPLHLDLSKLACLGETLSFSVVQEPEFSSLIERIEQAFLSDEAALREGQIISNTRQRASLEQTKAGITQALEQIRFGQKDLASLSLEGALSALLEIDGKSAGEQILDAVFSRFCVGK